MEAVSAVVFLVGSLVIAGVGVYAWLYIIIAATKSLGWVAGAILAILSIAAYGRWDEAVKRPWTLWAELWQWADWNIREKRGRAQLERLKAAGHSR